jgi:hypothetical protein
MDNYNILLATYVKKCIFSNLNKIQYDDPKYNDIVRGGKLIWYKYYKSVLNYEISYTFATNRLEIELKNNSDDIKYIQAYINTFGKFWKV